MAAWSHVLYLIEMCGVQTAQILFLPLALHFQMSTVIQVDEMDGKLEEERLCVMKALGAL